MLIPKELVGISKIAARESTRYAIAGVHVVARKDGKAVVSVTDGRRLVQVSFDGEARAEEMSTIVPRNVWNDLLNAIGADQPHGRLAATDKKVTLSSRCDGVARQLTAEPCRGKFPDTAGIIPSYEIGKDAQKIGMDLSLLSELLAVVSGIVGRDLPHRTHLIVPTDSLKPLLIKGDNGEGLQVVAVIMPAKCE